VPSGLDFGADSRALRFDPRAGAFGIEGLSTRIAGITAEWRPDVRNVIDAPQIEGDLQIADAAVGAALESLGVALPDGLDPTALGGIDASAEFRVALSLANAADRGDSAAPAVGPYRLDELRLDAVTVDILGATLRGAAELGEGGILRADLDVPEHPPSDALRALAAAHVPEGIDLAAVDRVGLSGRIELGLADGRAALHDARLALLGTELAATLDASPPSGSGRVLRGTFSAPRLDPERVARLLGERMPAAISPEELGTLALAARFEYDTAARRIALDDVALEAFGLAATGRAVVTGLGERAAASGEARVAPFSPRALLERFGQPVPETSDPAALQRAAVTARFEADADGGRFRDIDLTLDDTRITGEYAIDGLANPAHRFTLTIDRV